MVTNLKATTYRPEGIRYDRVSQDERLNEAGPSRPMPVHLVEKYADLAVRHAMVMQEDDGMWLAKIDGFPGVWASEPSVVEALAVLKEVVFEWALLKIEDADRDLPPLGDINLNVF